MTDADAGAEYLASIFGTEKDKYVNSVSIFIEWLLLVVYSIRDSMGDQIVNFKWNRKFCL